MTRHLTGFPPVASKVALVDFDGTLFPFGSLMEGGPPIPGAAEAVRALEQAGYRIGIFTSRLSKAWWRSEGMKFKAAEAEQRRYITEQCGLYAIPFDFITAEKIPAEVYFDDRAIGVNAYYPLDDAVEDWLYGREFDKEGPT